MAKKLGYGFLTQQTHFQLIWSKKHTLNLVLQHLETNLAIQ
jgi:hypothetical protein